MTYPAHWNLASLGEERYFRVATGGTPDTDHPEYYGGDVRWLKSGDVSGLYIDDVPTRITELGLANSNARLHPTGSIVLAMSGRGKTRGTTAVLRVPCTCSQSVAAIIPESEQVVPEFVHFNLASRYDELRNLTGSLDRSGLNLNLIRRIRVPIAPVPEQRAIAEALRAVQNAKDARRKELELERERKAALMEYLFTHGTRNEPTKMTEIGEMPESWEVVALRDVTSGGPQNGAFIKSPAWGDGTLYVNVVDMYENAVLQWSSVEHLACNDSLLQTHGLARGDLLFVRSSLKREGVAQCCLIDSTPEPAIFDCHLIRVPLDGTLVNPLFVTHFYLSQRGRTDLVARSKTTTMTTINQDGLMSAAMPLPGLVDEQNDIADCLSLCAARISALEKEASVLDELFKAMLEELMTGRLSAVPLIEETRSQ